MSYFGLLGAFGNKRHAFLFGLSCKLASEATRKSTMQIGFLGLFVQPLMLRSLKAVRKEATRVVMILGRTSPAPGVVSPVEL